MNAHAPRRFYQDAAPFVLDAGFGVKLDARVLKSPAGATLRAPTRALAEACAGEWAAQGLYIIPTSMPLTQLCFAAIDWTSKIREQRADYVASFGGTDLCCHRAEAPVELVARQAAAWDPLVAWGVQTLGLRLPVTTGVIAAMVPAETLAALRLQALALDDFRLTALAQGAGLAGSALIGFALLKMAIDAEQAFAAAALDDLWSLERWGEDGEARARLDAQHAEWRAIGRFVAALEAP